MQPPKEALQARRKRASAALNADYYHAVLKPAGSGERKRGYRPHPKSQQRQRGATKLDCARAALHNHLRGGGSQANRTLA